MKKVISIILIVLSMMLFSTSCKKMQAEFVVTKLEGIGDYSEADDTSAIKVEAWFRIEQPGVAKEPLALQLVQWQFTLLEGTQPVMALNNQTVFATLGAVHENTSSVRNDFLWVLIDTTTRKPGDIFYGAQPDTLEFQATAQDLDGNLYEIAVATNFVFTKN